MFGASPVVVKIDDQGVVKFLGFLKGSDDCADGLVHVVHHRCVDRHIADSPGFMVYGVPRLDATLQRGKRPSRLVDNAHFEHAGIALVAQFLPTTFIGLDVFLDGFLWSMDGPVGGSEGDVLKEWFVGLGECLDLTFGLHAYAVGVVIVLLIDLSELGVAGQSIWIEEGAGACHGTIEIVESTLNGTVLCGISAEVPLPHHAGLVTSWL